MCELCQSLKWALQCHRDTNKLYFYLCYLQSLRSVTNQLTFGKLLASLLFLGINPSLFFFEFLELLKVLVGWV